MTIFDIQIDALGGGPADLAQYRGSALLIVNVASKCGLTPQYAGLQALHDDVRRPRPGGARGAVQPVRRPGARHGRRDRRVLPGQLRRDVPADREDGGERAGPAPALRRSWWTPPDAEGHTGDIRWNFEKFLVAPDGKVAARFGPHGRPRTPAELRAAIEEGLPA